MTTNVSIHPVTQETIKFYVSDNGSNYKVREFVTEKQKANKKTPCT